MSVLYSSSNFLVTFVRGVRHWWPVFFLSGSSLSGLTSPAFFFCLVLTPDLSTVEAEHEAPLNISRMSLVG